MAEKPSTLVIRRKLGHKKFQEMGKIKIDLSRFVYLPTEKLFEDIYEFRDIYPPIAPAAYVFVDIIVRPFKEKALSFLF